MSDGYVAEVIDEACEKWFLIAAHGEPAPTEIRVNGQVYAAVAAAKAQEVSRGNPLFLLGLPLVSSDSVPPAHAEIA